MKAPSELATSRWNAAIAEWLRALDREDNDTDVEAFRRYLDALREFFEALAVSVASRDRWEPFFSGSTVILRSKKLTHNFSLDVDDLAGRLRLASSIAYFQHLPKMTDDFWKTIVELHGHGAVAFASNICSTDSKSIIWAIAEDHAALANSPREHGNGNPFVDAGTIEISWPLGKGIETLCYKADAAMRGLYHLNYLLYRHEYIIQAARRKGRRTNQARARGKHTP